MYPHQNNIRERRGGQPPMAPHLMGMPQQGPGVIMSMPNQPVQIMQNHHYTNQNSYSTQGQTNVSSYMTQQQGPPQQSTYNQSNYSNPQVVLSKQAVNRSKNYRKEYNVVKDSMNYNSSDHPKNHNSFGSSEYNPGTFGSYNQSSYNGQHYQPQQHQQPHQQPHQQHPQPHQQHPQPHQQHSQPHQQHSQPHQQHSQPHQQHQQSHQHQQQSHQHQQQSHQHQQQSHQHQQQSHQHQQQQHHHNHQHQQQHQHQHQQELVNEKPGKHSEIKSSMKEKKENSIENVKKNSEKNQDCSQMKSLLTNGKEKTPMCLVNELARFNKISHQYRLTNEQGPAHKKSFTVTLKLDKEEYTAEGTSIKKAQHSAAAEALSKTSFPHPVPKANKNHHSLKLNVTPTVELNALAMKRGEPTVYQLLHPPPAQLMVQPQTSYYRRTFTIHRRWNKRGRNSYFSRNGRMPIESILPPNASYRVSLKVGAWEFVGEGPSLQSARHDAASKALSQFKNRPLPEDDSTNKLKKENTVLASSKDREYESVVKSPISLVHEIALKRNLSVIFEVVSEKGPAHMKAFVTKCIVGDLTATGEGNAKKASKKRAAENMLIELKKLPPLSPSLTLRDMVLSRIKRKSTGGKKKSRNLIKIERKSDPGFGEDANPISRLIHIQQLKKEKEPVYTLLEEKGMPRRREFVMEVSAGPLKAVGSGPNKKCAKKTAAENLLAVLGYATVDGNSGKTSQDSSPDLNKDSRKVTFIDSDKSSDNIGGSLGRQLKPGIYVMSNDQHCSSVNSSTSPVSLQTTATIAKELLKGGNSPTADALVQKSSLSKSTTVQSIKHGFRPKDQLLYLADLLHFQVQFSDFPKGNHSEFLTLVTMSTDPSHVCHGSGQTIEESQDQAALTALRALSEMGVDSVTPQNTSKEMKKNVKGMGTLKK